MKWRNAIACVEVKDNDQNIIRGTAFLVTKSLVLTALHVVADRQKTPPKFYSERIELTFDYPDDHSASRHTTEAVPEAFLDPNNDWILLKCLSPPPNVKPLPLIPIAKEGSNWSTYGFPDDKPDSFEATGTLTSNSVPATGMRALQLYSKEAAAGKGLRAAGCSGAPVVVHRDAPGAPEGTERVVAGLLRWALSNADGTVKGGSLYACPMDVILKSCGRKLPNYDHFSRAALRWLKRVGPRFLRQATKVLFNLFFWVVFLGALAVLPFIILNWPEEWAFRTSFADDETDCAVSFAFQDKDFAIGSSSGKTNHLQLAGLLENIWKKWTTHTKHPYNYLVVRLPKPFDSWYYPFDAEIQVSFDNSGQQEKATIDTAAAFLTKEAASIIDGKPVSRFRQQLVFTDFIQEDRSKKRPCVVHLAPPNKGEDLLLLLRISPEETLPPDSTKVHVKLKKTKGPYP